MKMRIATLNVRGMQSQGSWRGFLDAAIKWTRRNRISVLLIQEHNMPPSRVADAQRDAKIVGLTAVIGCAPPAPDGVCRGGCMTLSWNSEVEICDTLLVTGSIIRLRVSWGGKIREIVNVYAPAQPAARLSWIQSTAQHIGPDSIAGGDWNCVPDVTLDVKGKNALNYPNIGANELALIMETNHLDIRREQLEFQFEHTRKGTKDEVATRLDRFYVPTGDEHDTTLWTIETQDDLVWKFTPTDHLAVTLTIEDTQGERGHDRPSIRESIIARPEVQATITKIVNEAYKKSKLTEGEKWEKTHRMLKHELIALTAAEKKKEKPKILQLRYLLNIQKKIIDRDGPSEPLAKERERLSKELKALESPETTQELTIEGAISASDKS